MLLADLVAHKDLQLPLKSDGSVEHHVFLADLFSRFDAAVKLLDPGEPAAFEILAGHPAALAQANELVEVQKEHDSGDPRSAAERGMSLFDSMQPLFEDVQFYRTSPLSSRFYRMRASKGEVLSKKELLDIPRDKRQFAGPQRYSLGGMPTLYCGGSIYTCWNEVGQPPLDQTYVTALWVRANPTVEILDFGRSPKYLHGWIDKNPHPPATDPSRQAWVEFVAASVLIWPLVAACSVRATGRGDPYIPEYVIPQILMQWIARGQKYIGIRYFSTRLTPCVTDPAGICNFAILGSTTNFGRHHVEFRDNLRMTEPYSFRALDASQADLVNQANAGHYAKDHPSYYIELVDGFPERYSLTTFGRVEGKINNIATKESLAGGGSLP